MAEEAWLAGEVGEAQVAALARARTPATSEAMERDEELLVGEAMRLGFESFVQVLAYWSQHADPDGVEDDAASGRAARRFHLSQRFEHMWWGDLVLDPISGAILAKALSRLEEELFEADWAEARARLGEDGRQRAGGLWAPQPPAAPTNLAAASGVGRRRSWTGSSHLQRPPWRR